MSADHARLRPSSLAASGVALLVLLVCAYFAFRPRAPQPPAVITAGLDPAVANLIDSTLQEVRQAPGSGAAWGKLASVLMHYEFIEESRTAFSQAEKRSPQDPRWPYLHALLLTTYEPETALPKLQRAVELAHDRPDMPRLRLAQLLAERGREDEAERHFRLLLQLRPDHPLALLGLARLSQQRDRLAESTNLLHRCLNDPSTAKSAHALLAAVERALGNPEAASAAARQSAALPSDQPWPDPYGAEAAGYRVGRKASIEDATSLLDQGRPAEAVRLLGSITGAYPEDGEAWYLLGWAHNQQQRPAEAERALREHLRISPGSPKGHAQWAVALLNQQRYAEAMQILEAAVQLKPTWRELHFNLGYACAQLGRIDEAISHWNTALAQDPNYLPTYAALAELLNRRGESAQAVRLLRQALELEPGNQPALSLLQRIESKQP